MRASCRVYAFRVALGTLLASCVRSDARRRQSRSLLSNGSDFDIAHRLDRPCTALHGIARPVGGLRHTRKQKDAKTLRRAALRNIRAKKAPRHGGAFPKALNFGLAVRRPGGGAISSSSILVMSAGLAQRSPERVLHFSPAGTGSLRSAAVLDRDFRRQQTQIRGGFIRARQPIAPIRVASESHGGSNDSATHIC